MSDVDIGILLSVVVGVDRYEVGRFGESMLDLPNQVKLVGSQQQAHNEIHAYVIPLPF
jgi:hypothetical protein